ncbi:hypothetical protein CDAR_317481 [Caerostris darwini]|uniref:Uncharacterized protein n=1 Tax=Caerostris darwini TaxID=1538125 RepID=A0AAV4Q9B8_9ARAC|nr:hypothetical protein CDAR_317481 [Caerostris darwini]
MQLSLVKKNENSVLSTFLIIYFYNETSRRLKGHGEEECRTRKKRMTVLVVRLGENNRGGRGKYFGLISVKTKERKRAEDTQTLTVLMFFYSPGVFFI